MSHSEEMLQALNENDLVKANLAFQQALKKDPEDLLAALGEALYQLGFIEEATEVYEHLLVKSPKNSGYLLSLGELAIEGDQYDEAFAYFDEIPNTSPDYPAALLDLADLYQLLDLPEVAEGKLKQALKILPGEPLINFALGELYYSLQRFLEAASYYLLLQMQGEKEIAGTLLVERLGVSYALSGKFEEAIAPLTEALENEVTEDRLFYLAYTYQQLKENDRAIELYQQLLTLNPEYTTLYAPLGKLYQEEEQLAQAQETFEAGISQNPYQVDLYLLASENAYRLHEETTAIELLEKALELGEKEEEVVGNLGHLYLENGDYEKVLTLYQTHDVDTPQGLWDQGKAHYELENYGEGLALFNQAYEGLKEEPEFLREYGLFLREEGQLDQAKAVLEHYVAHETQDLEIISLLEMLNSEEF